MNKFSERLTALCEHNGISQTELARDMGVDRTTVNKYMKGTREPNFDFIARLATRFGVSTDYLIGVVTPADNQTA